MNTMSGARQACAPYGHEWSKAVDDRHKLYHAEQMAFERWVEQSKKVVLGVSYIPKSGEIIAVTPHNEVTAYAGVIVDVFADNAVVIHATLGTDTVSPMYVATGSTISKLESIPNHLRPDFFGGGWQ